MNTFTKFIVVFSLLIAVVLAYQIISKIEIFGIKPVQTVAEAVKENSEELTLTGIFKIVKITPTTLIIINTDSENPGAYEVNYPTNVHYELEQPVNASVKFKHVSEQLFQLVDIVVKRR